VFAANYLRPCPFLARLCDLRNLCVEIPTHLDSGSYISARIFSQNAQNRFFQIRDLRTLHFPYPASLAFATPVRILHPGRSAGRNLPGATQQFPIWNESLWFNLQLSTLDARIIPYPLSFHILAHSLARRKTQLFYFQAIPHSLPKDTRGGGTLVTRKPAKPLLGYTLFPRRNSCSKQPRAPC
jgi:hypothetical protein